MQQMAADDFKALSRMAGDRIKEYIVSNRLEPGDRLPPERKLAETLEVSRPVVREALSHLETLGLVDKRQGRGVFVKEQNLSRLFQEMMFMTGKDREKRRQLLEFRMILEQAAVLQAIGRVKNKDVEPLLQIVDEAERAATDSEFNKLDLAFHRRLVGLSANPYLLQLTDVIDSYFALIESYDSSNSLQEEGRRTTLREHRKLATLLKQGKRGQTLDLLQEHLMPKTRRDERQPAEAEPGTTSP